MFRRYCCLLVFAAAAVCQTQTQPPESLPPPTANEQSEILDAVRHYVSSYDGSLPDFTCSELEERFVGDRSRGVPSYRAVDTIVSRLTYFEHHELKTPVLHNNVPVAQGAVSLGGSSSQGDFANMLRDVFDPQTQARFEWVRWASTRDRRTMVFGFHVEQAQSRYVVDMPDRKLAIVAAYSGEVLVDAEPPHAVMALEIRAENIPAGFPIRRAQLRLDYQYVDIGGRRFLLPASGEVQLEAAGWMARNFNSFNNYRKYEVASEITFDAPKDVKK